MDKLGIRLSRISKLLVDGCELTTEEALSRRQKYAITLMCGVEVAQSRTLQLAVLTAANIGNRCFPNAVTVMLEHSLPEAPLLVWPALERTFGRAVIEILGPDAVRGFDNAQPGGRTLLFGNTAPVHGALRVTFDGWIAKVGPAAAVDPLPQRQYCALSGVLAGALAVSELFMSFAELTIEAGRRTVGLSLWRPDLDIEDPLALGVQVEFLPRDLWVLGLGHLGNAYLSAASIEAEGFRPGPLGAKGLGQLAYDKRMRVLAASQSDQSAREIGGQIAEGVLTYTLLHDGIEAHQAANQAGNITLKSWLNYPIKRVPRLFVEIGNGKINDFGVPITKDAVPVAQSDIGAMSRNGALQNPSLFDFAKREGPIISLKSKQAG